MTSITVATPAPIVDLNGDGNGDVFTYDATTGDWTRQVSLPGGGFAQQQGAPPERTNLGPV